ncbi:MAG: OmpA family protein [Alphaproteobacteria bacterium]|nr:OmpA family protein [Alphaproteobacteria bacterium]
MAGRPGRRLWPVMQGVEMQGLMRLVVTGSLVASLGACTTWDRAELGKMSTTGGPFAEALLANYLEEGDSERAQFDWLNAAHFYNKAQAVSAGKTVLPDEVASRDLSAAKADELGKARARLLTALDGNGRTGEPRAGALAQAKFDCWLEQEAEGFQKADIDACKNDFEAAMRVLQFKPAAAAAAAAPAPAAPAPVAGKYSIYFDFASSDLTAAAKAEIKKIAADFKTAKPKTVQLIGHADTVGSAKKNQALGLDRAQTVASALIAEGVGFGAIKSSTKGDTALAVKTKKGTKEAQNRRVEVVFEK